MGVLWSESATVPGDTFQSWLGELGYEDGRNIAFESRFAVDRDPDAREVWQETQAAARTLGVHLESLEARARVDLEPAVQRGTQARIEGLAARLRMPAIYPSRYFVQPPQNGLMAYGPISFVIARRVASHVDRILKGARPSELPVEQPSEVELTINLQAAGALGLRLPPSLLGRADKVFE